MDRSSRHKINKETVALNYILGQIDRIDVYGTFHPKTAEYTFFPSAYEMFSRIYHVLGNKASLNKFKKIEIISSTFSNYSSMKVENNYKRINGKNTNT